MKKYVLWFLMVLVGFSLFAQEKFSISGYVKDSANGEELIGASVYIGSLKTGSTTNEYGFYSLTLPKGVYEITVSFLGYQNTRMKINLDSNRKLNFSMGTSQQVIKEVEITGEKKNRNVEEVEMSIVKLPIQTIRKIPALMGEVDIIKSLQLLPGVQFGGEGNTGFYVRGGNLDQNLILLDDAPVYNASHFAGFFSVFNNDAIKDVTLFKGGMPAEYGSKLSSIVDIRMKDGNSKQFSGTGGIGIISSRLTLEGPILKDKCSFIASGRRTYADLFFPFVAKDSLAKESRLFFYDLNTKINYTLDENNRFFLSGYFGRDVLWLGDMMGIDYGNATGTLRWNHIFSDKWFMNTTMIYSNYFYKLEMKQQLTSVLWNSDINDYNLKSDITWFLNPSNTMKFGLGSVFHSMDPGKIHAEIDTTKMDLDFPNNYALEHFIFCQNEQKISGLITLQYGLRFSAFQNIGKAEQYVYDRSDSSEYKVKDTLYYSSGKIFNTYSGLEPRFSVKYTLDELSSVKLSYNRTIQYIQLASNSTSATPLDIWFPCTPNVKPQKADQVAAGYFRNFRNNLFETSAEVYYKKMYNVIDFRDHAELLLNPFLEGELRIGEAYSYGLELFVRKNEGKFTGWISYTLSKTRRQIPEINGGKEYFAPYDKPHNLAIVVSYDILPNLNVSANWIYNTAPPRTMPTGRMEYGGMIVPVYSDRNTVRIFDYHRLDFSCTYNFKKKVREDGTPVKWESSLNLSLYNVYARKNPIQIDFKQSDENPDETYAQMTYLFKIVPSLTYNFKF